MPDQPSATAPLDSMTMPQKVQFVQGLMIYPALTVMVFVRRRLGFRQLKLTRLIGMAVFLAALGYFNDHKPVFSVMGGGFGGETGTFADSGAGLTLFALVMLVYGYIQHRRRWNDITHGVRWHTRTTGVSCFESLPFPSHVVHRYIDPLACLLVGAVVYFLSHPLGVWLMFSAVALSIYEQALYEIGLERDLDLLDGIVESEVQSEVAQHFISGKSGAAAPPPLPIEQTAGIPTGLAPDLTDQIHKRQKRAPLSDEPISPGNMGTGPSEPPPMPDEPPVSDEPPPMPDEPGASSRRPAPDNLV